MHHSFRPKLYRQKGRSKKYSGRVKSAEPDRNFFTLCHNTKGNFGDSLLTHALAKMTKIARRKRELMLKKHHAAKVLKVNIAHPIF